MKFAKLRKSKNITQIKLAEQLGVSNRTVSAWETGIATPKIKMIKKIAELLNVSSDEVLECFN